MGLKLMKLTERPSATRTPPSLRKWFQLRSRESIVSLLAEKEMGKPLNEYKVQIRTDKCVPVE